jgi:hypothetical protein
LKWIDHRTKVATIMNRKYILMYAIWRNINYTNVIYIYNTHQYLGCYLNNTCQTLLKSIKSWNWLKPILRRVNNTWWPAIKITMKHVNHEWQHLTLMSPIFDQSAVFTLQLIEMKICWTLIDSTKFSFRLNRSLDKSKFDLSGVKIQR